MIKPGQIYSHDMLKFCITHMTQSGFNSIETDGSVYTSFNGGELEDCQLIAEYPIWQEAINSKEFME